MRWALGGGCYFPATRCSWKSLCTWNFCGQSLVSSVDKAVGPLGTACGYRPSLRRAPQPQAEGLGPRCPRFLSVPVQSRPSGPVLPAPPPPVTAGREAKARHRSTGEGVRFVSDAVARATVL